jgi:hypothetical protein
VFEAARQAGVGRVVYTSVHLADAGTGDVTVLEETQPHHGFVAPSSPLVL